MTGFLRMFSGIVRHFKFQPVLSLHVCGSKGVQWQWYEFPANASICWRKICMVKELWHALRCTCYTDEWWFPFRVQIGWTDFVRNHVNHLCESVSTFVEACVLPGHSSPSTCVHPLKMNVPVSFRYIYSSRESFTTVSTLFAVNFLIVWLKNASLYYFLRLLE